MYELQILLEYFALKQDDELYKMYHDHGIYTAYKLEKSRREKGNKTYTTKAFNELEGLVEKMKAVYDMSKFKKDYGWAYKNIPQNTPNKKEFKFSDIEKLVDPEENLKIFYKSSCATIHLSSLGTFDNLSVIDNVNITPCGCSNYGLSIPGQLTAISIGHIMAAYNKILNTTYGNIIIVLLKAQIQSIKDAFSHAQKLIEDCSDKLTDEDVE